ncbi:type II toxin-antitoxin system HicA family toxin [Leptospira perdikensis]|uniref:Type II toxin-antitoxin system HicA family toxin n=1 Tax=Leptospira perdikensis TaxID=2484948 RepID=A0A4R9JEN9_9LEPT|nr:type II toxin-antitoxin system HicA family toxin [Leptospira perdikensis]TGL39026.1 type II toxin-antitoxin system HicA family toxin [Leptospira perdikensis]
MPKKVRDILQILFQDGWYIIDQKGSHIQMKHSEKPGRVTVPSHGLGKEVDIKTEKSILKQAGIGK